MFAKYHKSSQFKQNHVDNGDETTVGKSESEKSNFMFSLNKERSKQPSMYIAGLPNFLTFCSKFRWGNKGNTLLRDFKVRQDYFSGFSG